MLMETATSRYERIVAELEALCRTRVLTEAESRALENAINQCKPAGQRLHRLWLARDDREIATLLRRHPRPSVAELAKHFSITEGAMWRRLHKLRQAGKIGYFSAAGSTGRYDRQRFKTNG
jgi:hypothetical protein